MTEDLPTAEELSTMQDEIVAMILAWADRGVPPSDSALMIAGMAHAMIAKFDTMTLAEFVAIIRADWESNGGRL